MDKIKSGLKTTEFWLSLLAAILPVLNEHLGLELPTEAIITITATIISYILGRSIVKHGASKLIIIFALSSLLLALSFIAPLRASAITATATGVEVTLTWTEPTTNEDGSPLTDLAKIRIYHDCSGTMQVEKEVDASSHTGGAERSTVITVPIGKGQEKIISFYATALDESGNESIPSEIVCVRIDRLAPAPPQ